jgi:hypothetical protein
VEQRAAAAEARKERLLAQEAENQGKQYQCLNLWNISGECGVLSLVGGSAEDALDWKPSRPNWATSQQPRERSIKRLAELCVNKIADYVDCVESLVGLPQIYVVRFYCST